MGVAGFEGGFCFLTVRGSGLFELLGWLSIVVGRMLFKGGKFNRI